MTIELLRLLQTQRDLYDLPRGWERFGRYIATLTGGTDDLVLPLVLMNPMARPHVAAALDTLLALGAEAIAAAAIVEAERRLAAAPGALRVGLVVADEQGGWTDRFLTEARHWFADAFGRTRGWAIALCWAGETPSPEQVRQATLAAIYRSAYQQRHGLPRTLDQMLRQEGLTGRFAGASAPQLEPDDLDYTRQIIRAYRQADQFPTVFACLYGDAAARAVGYPPQGLSERAGFALALAEAQAASATPEEALT